MVKINRFSYGLLAIILTLFAGGCGSDSTASNPDPGPDPGPTAETIDWNAAADSSTQALIANFWNNYSNYWNVSTGDQRFAYWPGAHATDVLIDAYQRTGDDKYKTRIDNWYLGVQQQMNGTFINDFYDDMEWNALALLRAYNITDEQKFKESLDNLWVDIKGGWSDVAGGGIMWTKSNPRGKNAISNAPASILASRLYRLSGKEEDLDWAKKIYAWEKNKLVNPNTGAVWDNVQVQSDGTEVIKKDWIFTYNEGVYIGAALELYQITGNQPYLNDAVQAAGYTLNSLTNTDDQLLKDEGDGDGGLFKGIFVRYFTQLILEEDLLASTRDRYIQFFKHNAQILWTEGKSSNTLYSSYWKDKPGVYDEVDLSVEASGSILMEAAALLSDQGMLDSE